MKAESRLLLGHLAVAVSRYVREEQRAARASGRELPAALLDVAELLVILARARPDATSFADPLPGAEAGDMNRGQGGLVEKREAAAILRLSVRQVERLIASGKLVAVKVGGRTRIRRADLDAFVAGLPPSRGSFRDSVTEKDTA